MTTNNAVNTMKQILKALQILLLVTVSVASQAAVESTTYILTDHLGSPILATDENGDTLWQEDYLPYGKQITNEDGDNSVGFTGHKDDKALGVTYMQGRWYHQDMGRFLAIDPVGFVEGNPFSFNRYSYGNSNPFRFIDPDGRNADEVWAALGQDNPQAAGRDAAKSIGSGFSSTANAIDEQATDWTNYIPGWAYGKLAAAGIIGAKVATKSRNSAIGFADNATEMALSNVGRVDHAARHLIDAGLIKANPGSKAARQEFQEIAHGILTNPLKTFDHTMSRGGQAVKGFYGQVNGSDVIILVAKEAKGKVKAGDIVTSMIPSDQQMKNFGL